MPTAHPEIHEVVCETWNDLLRGLEDAHNRLDLRDGEDLWFRGSQDSRYTLTPTLMRVTEGQTVSQHDAIERNLFFEFQARAAELRARGLNDWEYLFFGRHYDVPTRVLDWTDTFGVALYFALELQERRLRSNNTDQPIEGVPVIWILNPYALNVRTWDKRDRDITLPKYLGLFKGHYWDFGELLAADGRWGWDKPVAIYPAQINDRVRAQRGWFTIHGNDRRPLENQVPDEVVKLVLYRKCVDEALKFLALAGVNRFSIYPDLENLARWIRQENVEYSEVLRVRKARHRRRDIGIQKVRRARSTRRSTK
jgi:hypothetical protein